MWPCCAYFLKISYFRFGNCMFVSVQIASNKYPELPSIVIMWRRYFWSPVDTIQSDHHENL
uniref:Uncharacterized protein n=1 Tax=Onchocerca volvulus TaxID=6282 RepID=A0A8R1U1I1_ONCVO